MTHQPVLLQAVERALRLQPGEILVDATVNRGGHSLALCPALGNTGILLGIDQDGTALRAAKTNLANCPGRVILVHNNFRRLQQIAAAEQLTVVDAVLFDLGLSSEQLAATERGFSFQTNGPLRMSFQTEPAAEAITAAEVVNDWSEEHLADIIHGFGEEVFARRIAAGIVAARRYRKIENTGELVEIIRQATPGWYHEGRRHFATKTFQALRMAVNDEWGALSEGLAAAWNLLRPGGGRLAVISFHSLEARLVKHFFRAQVLNGTGRWRPAKAEKASRAEVLANPRARSAQLRTLVKI